MAIGAIFYSFFRSVGQMGDPRFRRVILLGIVLAFVLLVAAYAATLGLIQWLVGEEAIFPLIGEVRWLDDLLSWSSLLVMTIMSVFLMVPVASAITSMFLEDVARAVEERHYPHIPPAKGTRFYEGLRDTINFLGVLIGANLLAFFLYAMMPPLSVFIFWGLNGFLLGREYFMLAAIRRIGRSAARDLRKANAGTIWLAGILMTVPLSVPFVNLLIPVLGAATFTHLFHALTRDAPAARSA